MLIYTSARILLDIYVPQNSLWVIFAEKWPTKGTELPKLISGELKPKEMEAET